MLSRLLLYSLISISPLQNKIFRSMLYHTIFYKTINFSVTHIGSQAFLICTSSKIVLLDHQVFQLPHFRLLQSWPPNLGLLCLLFLFCMFLQSPVLEMHCFAWQCIYTLHATNKGYKIAGTHILPTPLMLLFFINYCLATYIKYIW
jgi:hypothetical protein